MTALLDHERIIINQKAKLIEIVNEYAIRDESGQDIGVIRQEGQNKLKKVARLVQFTRPVHDPYAQRVRSFR